MTAFALRPEQAQHFDRPLAAAAEPVRHPRIELGGLARVQDEVLIAQHEPEPAIQDVEPLVALVGLRLGRGAPDRDGTFICRADRVGGMVGG